MIGLDFHEAGHFSAQKKGRKVFFKAKGDEEIIKPIYLRGMFRKVATTVILFFIRDHMEMFLKTAGYDEAKPRRILNFQYYPPQKKGAPGIAGPAVGAPEAAAVMEALLALGAKKVIAFGVCGSLQKEISIGDFFVPESAFSQEGTSAHYFPGVKTFEADPDLVMKIRRHLDEKKVPHHCGTACTTDAFFRETADKVRQWSEQGLQGIEMEHSALCAVAKFRGGAYASLMVVSDELVSMLWKPGFAFPRYRKALKRAMELLAEVDFGS